MKRSKTLLRVLLPVLLVLLAAFATRAIISSRPVPEPTPPDSQAPLVHTQVAQTEPVVLSVHAQGTVLPRTETTLKSEVAARVIEVSPVLANGGFFEQGDVLLSLDDTDYQLALEEARAAVAQGMTRLMQEEADASVARRDWEALGAQGEPSPLVLRVPQLEQARAELASAKARLSKAQRDVTRTTIRAPYPGRVRSRSVDPGQFVDRGAQLAVIYAVDYAEVRLPIPDSDLALLDIPLVRPLSAENQAGPGPPVVLSAFFARAHHRWEATVVRTEGSIDPMTRSVVLVVRVDDPYGRGETSDRPPLLAGLFVDARIEGRTLPAVVTLPREALRSAGRVFVLDEEHRLRIRTVEVVTSDPQRVVLSRGVEPGEQVVLSPIELPVEGMLLRPSDSEESR